ncbi:MAG TPA: trehalose-phosphatase [Anaerolineales bacterium]|nr:trehalose-phosphatase [Anaerolineales bacterium]
MYWKENLSLWQRLVRQPGFALVTDVDGTISPIVDQPDQAAVSPTIRPLLDDLCDLLPVVGVLSGRRVEDVRQRVGVPGLVYIGNHGLERFYQGNVVIPESVKPFIQKLAAAAEEIQPALLPGMMLEDKTATLTIHYRQTHSEAEVLEKFTPFVKELAQRLGVDLFSGRKVYELRPPIGVDKGTAFAGLLQDFNVQAAVYLGDDTTDAAAFKKAQALRAAGECQAYSLGVESANTPPEVLTYADYLVDGVGDVAAFFAMLLDSARASST